MLRVCWYDVCVGRDEGWGVKGLGWVCVLGGMDRMGVCVWYLSFVD